MRDLVPATEPQLGDEVAQVQLTGVQLRDHMTPSMSRRLGVRFLDPSI